MSFTHCTSKRVLSPPTLASVCLPTEQKPVYPGHLKGLLEAPCVGLCKDAYSISLLQAAFCLVFVLSKPPNEIKLCLVKVCVPRSLRILLFISVCYTRRTVPPFEGTDCFQSTPAASSCIQVAWLQQHFTGFSLKAKCVCSFWGPSSGNGSHPMPKKAVNSFVSRYREHVLYNPKHQRDPHVKGVQTCKNVPKSP